MNWPIITVSILTLASLIYYARNEYPYHLVGNFIDNVHALANIPGSDL